MHQRISAEYFAYTGSYSRGIYGLREAVEEVAPPPCETDNCPLREACSAGELACADYWFYTRDRGELSSGKKIFGKDMAEMTPEERRTPTRRGFKAVFK